ncbi:unnamed protein product, partial [Ectocarpus sp. 12 AP-2014]
RKTEVGATGRKEGSGGGGGVANSDGAPAAAAAGVSLTPAVSRGLRRGYLAQTLARIVGVAAFVREARKAGYGGDMAAPGVSGSAGSPTTTSPPTERSFPQQQSGGVVGAGGGGQQQPG